MPRICDVENSRNLHRLAVIPILATFRVGHYGGCCSAVSVHHVSALVGVPRMARSTTGKAKAFFRANPSGAFDQSLQDIQKLPLIKDPAEERRLARRVQPGGGKGPRRPPPPPPPVPISPPHKNPGHPPPPPPPVGHR